MKKGALEMRKNEVLFSGTSRCFGYSNYGNDKVFSLPILSYFSLESKHVETRILVEFEPYPIR